MSFKINAFLCAVGLFVCAGNVKTQEDAGLKSTTIQLPRVAIEKLANVTNEESLWILLPSNFTENQHLNANDFSLFKLNTDQLELGEADPSEPNSWIAAESDPNLDRATRDARSSSAALRDGRKMNIFANVLNKPKVSPLYLVNGTVCRFINTQPICTTLSTTGLFRGQTPIQTNGNGFGNLFQGQQPQQQQQQQQGNNNNNFNPQQRQVSPNTQGFNNQQPNFQQFRPAALLEDDGQDLIVEATNSSSRSVGQTKSKPSRQQIMNVVQTTRPLNYIASRRPLNLLSFGRPFRSQLQRRGKGLSDPSQSNLVVAD